MKSPAPCLKTQQVLQQLPMQGLFREQGLPWLISPQPLQLPAKLRQTIERLGPVLAKFQDTSHTLYRRSASGKEFPWLAQALNAGKPDWLIQCQNSKTLSQSAPRIIRPDLILQADSLALSELDSVPGGMGITHFLNKIYTQAGFDNIIGGAQGMTQGFQSAYPEGRQIAISQESADYAPEMHYFASQLGNKYQCVAAEQLHGQNQQNPIYRFFELFDTDQIPAAQQLLQRCATGQLQLDPPPIPHLEEKAWLALFHQPALQTWWKQNLRGTHHDTLQQLIPHTWLMDATPLPPNAALPWLNLHNWQQVGQLSQKERRLVLKISGFNQLAWGARGVHIGHDMPAQEWQNHIQQALDAQNKQCWVMQEFKEAAIIQHPYYDRETGEIKTMNGRARLCPYYFRSADGKNSQLGGCLATIVPADKKKIHGMKDAILVPCC